MSNIIQAADSIKKLSLLFKDMVLAADALTLIGSLEQAEEEAKKRIDAARADEEIAQAALVEAKAALQQAKADASAVIEASATAASEQLAKAKQDAQDIRRAAAESANAIEAEANTKAATIVTEAQRYADAVIAKAAEFEQKMAEANAAFTARADELSVLETKIADAKASIAQMLGQ